MLVLAADSPISLLVPDVGTVRVKPARPERRGPASLLSMRLMDGRELRVGWKPTGRSSGKFLIDVPDDVSVVRDNACRREAA